MHSPRFSWIASLALLWFCLFALAGEAQQGKEELAPHRNIIGSDVAHLRDQAGRGDAMAEYQLGKLYMSGKGVSSNYLEAARYLREAADKGIAQAEVVLGYLYEQGKGVPRDYRIALGYYAAAERQGDLTAANNLAAMYEHGLGVWREIAGSQHVNLTHSDCCELRYHAAARQNIRGR